MEDKKHKGYIVPIPISNEMVEENTLVGCKRCGYLWREPRMMLKYGGRINGPMYDYHYCDKCKKEDE